MKATVFYSWQATLPNVTNRGLIGDALKQAVAALGADDEIEIDFVVERDTSGVSGSPDIGRTILEKIDCASVFLGDVSIALKADDRCSPNPNVLVELGYALKALGSSRTLMVMNTAFGGPELLPFDLKQKRAITYDFAEGASDKADVRKGLAKSIEAAIRAILSDIKTANAQQQPVPKSPSQVAIEAIEGQRPDRQRHMRKFGEWFAAEAKKLDPSGATEGVPDDNLVAAIDTTVPLVDEFGRVAEAVAAMADKEGAHALFKSLEGVLAYCYLPRGFAGSFRSSNFDLFKFLTHELTVILTAHLMRENRWSLLSGLFDEQFYRGNSEVGQDVHERFTCLSEYVALLDEVRTKRLRQGNSQRLSFHADILKSRHDREQPVGAVAWDDFMGADVFLYFRGFNGQRGVWRAPTALYLGSHVPRFLSAATARTAATNLATALAFPDVDTMRNEVKKAATALVAHYERWTMSFFGFRGFDFDKIGTT